MELIDKGSILDEISLFASLSEEERDLIKDRINLKEYNKGELIYKEGSPADAFYCIILGRVVIYTQAPDGNETVLEYLHRGKYFGIISLLTGEPHSVTAKAINDCLLLTIKKGDFDFILDKVPRLAIDLSQTLSRRLKRKDIHQKTIFESTLISIFSSYSPVGKTLYALNLAFSLAQEAHKSALILEITSQDKIHCLPGKLEIQGDYKILDLSCSFNNKTNDLVDKGRDLAAHIRDSLKIARDFILKNKFAIDLMCVHYEAEDYSSVKYLVDILTILVNDYHYIILDLPSNMDKSVFKILNQSDLIHILTSPEPVDLAKTHNLIKRLKTEFNFQESKIKIIINEYRFAKLTHQQQLNLLGHEIFATLPRIEFGASDRLVLDEPASEFVRAIRRVSRQVAERQVGLVLGVGVAYGFCHIGVLKVIEEEKIPIDIITGSSIGAVIACLWAAGRSSQEILEIVACEFKEAKFIWSMVDLTFPWLGFIKGHKMYNFFKKYLGNKTFYDVKLPLKIIASDVRRKESKVFQEGLLADALMASCAMPGVFRPIRKEELIVDGGIANPLPTEILLKLGVRKIIAVNVTPSREDILGQYDLIKDKIAPAGEEAKRKGRFSLRQYFRNKFKTNILDIIFSSIEIMQSEVVKKEAQLADLVLHPDTQGLFWLELHRVREFAQRGEEVARRNLDKIWQVINE